MRIHGLLGASPEPGFPPYSPEFFVELCESHKIRIPCGDPDMEEVVGADIRAAVRAFHTLANGTGSKVVVEGERSAELVFTHRGVHFKVRETMPFCALIPLGHCKEKVQGVRAVVEHASVRPFSPRGVTLSSVIALIAVFYPAHDHEPIHCDIRLENYPTKR